MRYLPAGRGDIEKMLRAIGVHNVEELFSSIPEDLRAKGGDDSPAPLTEGQLTSHFAAMAEKNANTGSTPCFTGAGAYDHEIPSVIKHMLLRSEFYTAYTPYQPEISQGTLQAAFEFQTMMADLTGMELCNASLYDGASAAAEAALMAHRLHRGRRVLLAESLNPAYREVVKTYLEHTGLSIDTLPFGVSGRIDPESLVSHVAPDTCAVIVGQPNYFGIVEDLTSIAAALPREPKKPLLVASVPEALSLVLLDPPGSAGVDIVAGEARSFGLPLGYGGPYVGYVSTKTAYVRQMPGRIVGQTSDLDDKRGFVLTLSTREQHIRREKATSNICSNEGLCVLAVTIYLALYGRKKLVELAKLNLSKAEYLKGLLRKRGIEPLFDAPTFNEFAVRLSGKPAEALDRLAEENIIGGYDLSSDYPQLENGLLLCCTERVSAKDCERLADLLGGLS